MKFRYEISLRGSPGGQGKISRDREYRTMKRVAHDPYFSRRRSRTNISFPMSAPLDCIVLGLESRRRCHRERVYLTME